MGNDEQELTLAAVHYLAQRGIVIPDQPIPWETRAEFCRRVGISKRDFSRRIASRWCPLVDVERGPHGRLKALRSTPAFEAFMRRRLRSSGRNGAGNRPVEPI